MHDIAFLLLLGVCLTTFDCAASVRAFEVDCPAGTGTGYLTKREWREGLIENLEALQMESALKRMTKLAYLMVA